MATGGPTLTSQHTLCKLVNHDAQEGKGHAGKDSRRLPSMDGHKGLPEVMFDCLFHTEAKTFPSTTPLLRPQSDTYDFVNRSQTGSEAGSSNKAQRSWSQR